MENEPKSRIWNYGPLALAVLVIFLGIASVLYGMNVLPFDIFNLPAWVFCPLGVYSLIYALAVKRGSLYYAVWGLAMLAIGAVSASYNLLNPVVVIGILLIIIAVICIFAYWRSKIE